MEGEVRLVAPLKQSVATDLLTAAFVCCLLYFLSVLYCQDPSPVFAGFRCYSSPLKNTPPRTYFLSQRRLTKIVDKGATEKKVIRFQTLQNQNVSQMIQQLFNIFDPTNAPITSNRGHLCHVDCWLVVDLNFTHYPR